MSFAVSQDETFSVTTYPTSLAPTVIYTSPMPVLVKSSCLVKTAHSSNDSEKQGPVRKNSNDPMGSAWIAKEE